LSREYFKLPKGRFLPASDRFSTYDWTIYDLGGQFAGLEAVLLHTGSIVFRIAASADSWMLTDIFFPFNLSFVLRFALVADRVSRLLQQHWNFTYY